MADRPAITLRASDSLRHGADVMAHAGVGRLSVLSDGPDPVLVGMLTRSDLVGAPPAEDQGGARRRTRARQRMTKARDGAATATSET
ncbi:MAG: CBS domain-containing protein, partial [Myxococcaceae bacterium]